MAQNCLATRGMCVLTDVIFVRKDREAIAQEMQRDQRRILRVVVTVMLLATVGVFLTLSLQMDKAIESFVAEALSLGLFLAAAVWYAFRQRADRWRKAIAVYFWFLLIMFINDRVIKSGLYDELANSPRVHTPILYVSLSLLLIWLVPLWLVRAYPTQARAIGLDFRRLGHQILYGTLGASILIAHLLVTLLYSGSSLSLKPWPYIVFTFCYEVAAQSLGEELFFRGFLFNYLHHVCQGRLGQTVILVSLCNVLIYLVKFRMSGGLYELFGPAFYVFVMAVLNAVFFRQWGGILPGLILNVLFSMAGVLR